MKQKRLFFLIGFVLLQFSALAGVLQGHITNETGEALPFANIYVRNTTNGTTANEQGFYQLKLAPGTYEIVFQFIGYKPQVQQIVMGENVVERNVSLQSEALNLKEVVIKAGTKDPAYAMIKAAIGKRKYHLKETEAYKCRVYIKNLQRLTEVPKKVLGLVKVTDIKPGIIYLSESVSELSFKQPDKYREKLLSSKMSGSKKTVSFNQATDFEFDFYQNLIKVEGLTPRGFVSPIAANAFLFYKYQLIGTSEENGHFVHKIKVTPLRKNDPAFKGYIYLVDGDWRLHSVDLGLSKNTQLEFLDSAHMKQVFAPIANSGVWLPISKKLTLQFSGLGFKGNGYVNVIYSQYQAQPAAYVLAAKAVENSENAIAEELKTAAEETKTVGKTGKKVTRKTKQKTGPEPLFDKKHFNNEILSVAEEANKKDSVYWEDIRPIPLTEEEISDYKTKDSLVAIIESKPYKDSVDQVRNKFSFSSLFLGGYTYYHSFSKQTFSTDPLLAPLEYHSFLQYNTVEGVVLNPGFVYRKSFENRRYFEVAPMFRYGFSSEELYANLKTTWYYKPLKNATFTAEGGKFVSQFNSNNPITTFWNSVYTLLAERNYLKLYEKRYVKLEEKSEIINGLNLIATAEFADRHELFNATTYTFSDRESRQFTPNRPVVAELPDAGFGRNQAFTASMQLTWRPGQQYISRPDRKINLASKYPTFAVAYTKGFKNVFGSDVDFDRVAALVSDNVDLGLLGSSQYWFTGGTYLNSDKMWLMDYRHFTGNRTIYAGDFGGFQLLDYYLYSTKHTYFEGHFSHHFNGFILNKLPFIRKGKLQEVVNLNYLHTRESKNYLELGVGLEHIFKILRADFYTGFQEGQKVRTGFRLGFGF
ncbi:carboxypeptidase-like regulatory domain-containing protein [Adhaeribacter sp. BT258]|uniref:Carboxypeptidase-like regulatory domain-containing protein n=1 Tax=Adhaeribacter terrigena TaxID=2793070 RepID=A0ABS1C4T6_9BACT|nr:DUF5686 and carboxypeptidase regulatory-like domain-containing protein [Adhaeribacter terrigena]MBK0404369.1 carboxypeptidase-like regulatory domain-containing protein [Adhaeribacter terrigena]